jgi:hypothetical protein
MSCQNAATINIRHMDSLGTSRISGHFDQAPDIERHIRVCMRICPVLE